MDNSPASRFCTKCGTPLDLRTAIELQDEEKITDDVINILMEDKEFREFVHFKKTGDRRDVSQTARELNQLLFSIIMTSPSLTALNGTLFSIKYSTALPASLDSGWFDL
jgi:hypothetical protein